MKFSCNPNQQVNNLKFSHGVMTPPGAAGTASRKEAQQAQLAEKERLQKIPPEERVSDVAEVGWVERHDPSGFST